MNKIEYDDNYRYRRNSNFIENDQYNLHIKLRIGFFKHYFERSDFKPSLFLNKIRVYEFEELLDSIEYAVGNFFTMSVLLSIIYFSVFFFIITVPIICLVLAFCFDENTNIKPIFIVLVSSLIFGIIFLTLLRYCYVKTLRKNYQSIDSILKRENNDKYIKRNIIWSCGKNCVFLRANLIDNNLNYDPNFNYVPPNDYKALPMENNSKSSQMA